MYKKINVRVVSDGTILLHANTGANEFDPITMAIKKISSKKTKTEEEKLLMRDLEWVSGIYHDDKYSMAEVLCKKEPTEPFKNEGIYIPAENFERAIKEALKLSKKGKNCEAKFSLIENKVYIDFGGPKDIRKIFENPRYRDDRVVTVNGKSKIVRCRPRFERWEADFSIRYRPDYIDAEDLISALNTAGQIMGVGDYRPRYGRFSVEILEDIVDEAV